MSETNHVGLWNRCLDIIRDNVSEQTYKTWFCPIVPLKYEDKTLVVQVPSQFFYEFLEEKFLDLLRQTIHKVFGEGAKLMYNVVVVKNPPATVPLPPHVGPTNVSPTMRQAVTKEIPPNTTSRLSSRAKATNCPEAWPKPSLSIRQKPSSTPYSSMEPPGSERRT